MMKTMITETRVTFKELEKNIYAWVCQIGKEFTRELMERYDRMLMKHRDQKSTGIKVFVRLHTIKTIYGELTYRRAVYEVMEEDGFKQYVYLLDETLLLDNVGFISINMSELLVKGITELSYQECAAKVSEMTVLRISSIGVWNVMQALGKKVCKEETELVMEHKKGNIHGKKEVPVLFEEADGVYVSLQGKDRKRSRQRKAEMKVGIAYEGWKQTGKSRYELPEKIVVAGFEGAKGFHEYRKAVIAQKYNLKEVDERILNADGASWINKVKDKSTCFQLDLFHWNKAVREKIHDGKAVRDIMELLEEEKIGELFEYLELYKNSLWEVREIEEAEELIRYDRNNEEHLLPISHRVLSYGRIQNGWNTETWEQWRTMYGV